MTPLLIAACATCSEALLWSHYAPAIHWRWIMMFWFFFLTVVQLRTDDGVPGFPKKGTSFAICLLSLFLSIYVLGVFLAVVLIIPCLRCLITVLWKHQETLSRETKTLVYIPAIISIFIFSATILYEVIYPSPKDPVSFVLKYPGTVPGQSTIKRLGEETPPNLEALHTIIQQAPPSSVENAVSTLLESGNKSLGVAFCLNLLDKLEDNLEEKERRVRIEKALTENTLLNLPVNSSTKDWRRAWEEYQKSRQPVD